MAVQVEVFWIVTPCSVVLGYKHPPEGGGSMILRKAGMLPHHYKASEDLDLNLRRYKLKSLVR
jgi:hypothetical protein